ncbi:MAG TPA: antibiotic biosynthesis monooxygenase [Acidimicrobiia bacterium]
MFVRLFSSAVDPSDLADVRRIFGEDIAPVFESMPGCTSMELLLGIDRNAGGLVDAAALSRWKSPDELNAAIESREVAESMVRILPFLQLEPVIRMFEIIE